MVEFLDCTLRTCVVILIADIIQRGFYVTYEYFLQGSYYLPQDRLKTIVRRAYTYKKKTIYFILFVGFASIIRFGITGYVTSLMAGGEILIIIVLYRIFHYVQLSHSSLSYAHWIRESHGLDYAAGMASNYFHGYLKISLTERNYGGLKTRIQSYENVHNVTFALKRLIILIPDEMYVNGVIESDLLEKAQPLESLYLDRAGVNRSFNQSVYRFTKKINGTTYYVAMEGATPLLSFFESMNFQLSTTWQIQEMNREIFLKFCNHLKKLLKAWPETRQQVDLLIYNCICLFIPPKDIIINRLLLAHKPNGEPEDVGEVVMAHILEKMI